MYFLLKFLPKNHLSFLVGKLVDLRLPQPLAYLSVKLFALWFKIDCSEAKEGLWHYRCIGELFRRELKPGVRPLESELVSPVDARLRSHGTIEGLELEQIKGKTYALSDLLASSQMAASFSKGYFFNFYLAPPDYHHIHAPLSGEIIKHTYVPGKLWPVNDWSLSRVSDLFSRNERVITYIKSKFGLVAVVKVGATNVGRIRLSYDSRVTNKIFRCESRDSQDVNYSPPLPIEIGQRLASFEMGSSVILLVENSSFALNPGLNKQNEENFIKYGGALASS